MICLCLLLLVSQLDIDYPNAPAAWPLGPSVTPRRGYGQWNDYSEFHRALDFHGSAGDPVFAPYPNQGFWILAVSPDTLRGMCRADYTSVLLGVNQNDQWGWHYAHIHTNHQNYRLIRNHHYNRNVVSVLIAVPVLGSHVHFSWLGVDAYASGGPHPQMGYFNPFEYLSVPISFPPYDEAVFGPTTELRLYAILCTFSSSLT